MDDILSRFGNKLGKPMVSIRRSSDKTREDAYVMIKDTHIDGYRLRIVDKSLEPIDVNPEEFNGPMAEFVKLYNELSRNISGNIEWASDIAGGIPLGGNGVLMTLLRSCGNLIDEKGNSLAFSDIHANLIFNIAKLPDSDKMMGVIRLEIDGEILPDVPNFVSNNCVLAGSNVYFTDDVGDNFLNLNLFYQSFSESDITLMLSLFLTYFNHITPRIEGFVYRESKVAESYVPTIIIEQIDASNSLYLRLDQTSRSLPDKAAEMGLTFIVRRKDNILTGHAVNPIDLHEYSARLKTSIRQSAPTRELAKEIYDEDNFYILPEKVASGFLFNKLPSLLSDYRLIGIDKLKTYKVRPVTPKLSVNLSSGIDFLEGSAQVAVGEETFSLSDFIKRYSTNRYIQLSDGNRAIIDPDYMKRLERIYLHNRGKKGEFKISFFDLPEIEELLDNQLKGKGAEACRKVYSGFSKLPSQKLRVPGLKAELRPYQKEGVKWINYLYENNLGGCLADDMGLGKTIQTISMLLKIYPDETKPTLIVMPRSLLFNWENELNRFAPSLTHSIYYGSDRNLSKALESQVVLTTYAIVRNDIEELRKIEFQYIVLDESQNIKNTDAQVSRAVWLLNSRHRLAISGTPIENSLTDLYSLFRFLNPTMFGSLEDFNANYTIPIQKRDDELAANELRRKIFPFVLRRLKREVLNDLPDLITQSIDVDMEPAQATFYERRRAYYYERIHKQIATEGLAKSQFMMLQALTELRRIASVPESLSDGEVRSAKMPLLIDKLSDLAANGHKTVVFFNFVAGIEIAGEELERLGIEYETMTGSTTKRKNVIDRFQNNPECKVLLMTLKTGGVGLNLTAADTVIIYEPWWNAAAEQQGINRLHRIGQKKKVMSISLFTKSTIEEKIRELQERKSLLVDDIISSDTGMSKQLTEEDIDFILG